MAIITCMPGHRSVLLVLFLLLLSLGRCQPNDDDKTRKQPFIKRGLRRSSQQQQPPEATTPVHAASDRVTMHNDNDNIEPEANNSPRRENEAMPNDNGGGNKRKLQKKKKKNHKYTYQSIHKTKKGLQDFLTMAEASGISLEEIEKLDLDLFQSKEYQFYNGKIEPVNAVDKVVIYDNTASKKVPESAIRVGPRQSFMDEFKLENVALDTGEVLEIEVSTTIAPDQGYTCQVLGNNGNADLFVNTNNSTVFYCSSTSSTSYELCTAYNCGDDIESTVTVQVFAAGSFSGATVECYPGNYRFNNIIETEFGVVHQNLGVPEGGSILYSFPETIPAGEYVTCITSVDSSSPFGFSGNVDMFVGYGNAWEDFDCFSHNTFLGEFCVLRSDVDRQITVQLFGSLVTPSFDFQCHLGPPDGLTNPPTSLMAGSTLSGQSATTDEVILYQLDEVVNAGENITCSTSSSISSDVPAMYVYDGEPGLSSTNLLCMSSNFGSVAGCSIVPEEDDTTIYVMIRAPYFDLVDFNIICSVTDPVAPETIVIRPSMFTIIPEIPIVGTSHDYFIDTELGAPYQRLRCISFSPGPSDVDLFMGFNGVPLHDTDPLCGSENLGSFEECHIRIGTELQSGGYLFVKSIKGSVSAVLVVCAAFQPLLMDGITEENLRLDASFGGVDGNQSLIYRYNNALLAGDVLSCVTKACPDDSTEEDADLRLWFGAANAEDGILACTSSTKAKTSNEECIAIATKNVLELTSPGFYVEVIANDSFNDLSLTCTYNDTSSLTPLQLGVPLLGQNSVVGGSKFFIVTDSLFSGVEITCKTSGLNGNADLAGSFGNIPFVEGTPPCQSFNSDSNEECTLTAVDEASLYLSVHANETFSDLEIECGYTPTPSPTASRMPTAAPTLASMDPQNPTPLIFGESVNGLFGEAGQVFFFVYTAAGGSTAIPDDQVRCTAVGPNGDVSMGVRINDPLKAFDCVSDMEDTSNEECIVKSSGDINKAFLQVSAGSDAFSDLTIVCDLSNAPTGNPTPPPTPRPTIPFIPAPGT